MHDAINASTTKNFTQIPNELLRNNKLSGKAKALISVLLSNAEGWKTYKKQVQKYMKEGKDAIESGMKELENHGYLKRYTLRNNETKQFAGIMYAYTNTPYDFDEEGIKKRIESNGYYIQCAEKPGTENPSSATPSPGNKTLKRPIEKDTNNKKTNLNTCTPDFKKSVDVECNVSNILDKETPFLKKYKEIKNKIENKKYLELKNIKNNKIGDIQKFNRRSERKGIKLGDEEIFAALKVCNELDQEDHPFLFEYIEHESQLWDFSKTKNPEAVKAQFILECIDNAPTFLHFCKLRKNGDLNEEIRYYTVELKNNPENNENKTLLEKAMEMSPPSY